MCEVRCCHSHIVILPSTVLWLVSGQTVRVSSPASQGEFLPVLAVQCTSCRDFDMFSPKSVRNWGKKPDHTPAVGCG